MDNIKILDCTLRDGGYINDWKFGKKNINGIIANLVQAQIDIVECGFIRNVAADEDSSVFCSMEQLADVIGEKSSNTLYAVMIEQHNHVDSGIPFYDGRGADIIRVTFRRCEWEECKKTIASLIAKGYKVCVQPVGTTNYSDEELLILLKEVNELQPYAFYIVDTLGVMYRKDMRTFFYLVEKNLSSSIEIGFHSHNNLQMSFANAQELMRLATSRNIIIDCSCYGMGRGVGNLNTELLIDYINKIHAQTYSMTPVLGVIEKYLMPIYTEHRWGYDLPYLLSASVNCHPNYASHLMKKETLDIEDIEKLLSLIPIGDRCEFDQNLMERMYLEYQSAYVEDTEALEELARRINGQDVVLFASGPSILEEKDKISRIINGKFVITTNYISDEYKTDALFISNKKRYRSEAAIIGGFILSTSNLSIKNSLVFNYASLLGEGNEADNAGAMAIRLLKKVGVKKVWLAGFDGFDVNASLNYVVNDFKKIYDYDSAKKKNEDISKQLKIALNGIEYEFITRTKYEI